MRRKWRAFAYLPRLIFLLAGLGISFTIWTSVVNAQESQWPRRQRIPGTHDEALTPYLVADREGTVHAFFAQPVGEDDSRTAIFHSQWTPELGWTAPIDIILPPTGPVIQVNGLFLDQEDTVHLIFYAGDELVTSNLYYTKAAAVSARQAPAWSAPVVIRRNVVARAAALTGDGRGHLYVLYGADLASTVGLYATQSLDSGETWSDFSPVFLTYSDALFPFAIWLYGDQDGGVHATWAIHDTQGVGQTIYYARLDVSQQRWSDPVMLAEVGQTDERLELQMINRTSWPSVTKYDDELILIYMVCDPCARRMRQSFDGGETWTAPIEPFAPTRGEYGATYFVFDSNNLLHAIFGDRARGFQNIWHSVWQDGSWQEPSPIFPPSEPACISGAEDHCPTFPRTTISRGNVILVTWQTDRGHIHNGSWYTFTVLDAPELSTTISSTLTPVPTATPTPVVMDSTPQSTPTTDLIFTGDRGDDLTEFFSSPSAPLVYAILPAIMLILATIGFRNFVHRK